ncbi:hypothetical protein N2152v2_002032 [Parachlorella kessleri]
MTAQAPAWRQEVPSDEDAQLYISDDFRIWYRTQLCNDGPGCSRSICFFAHNLDELRTPAVKPYVSPEALARSSLAAIQQNPHPLAQQLASPFRTGSGAGGAAAGPAGRGRSSGDGAAAPPFSARPGPGAAQQQGPWGTAAARLAAPQNRQAGQPAAWHDSMGPATPRQLHQPQQPLRLSADYPTYIPAHGGRGPATGFLSQGQAGPSMGHYSGPAGEATPANPVGGGLALQAGPSGMGNWVDAQQQGGMGLGVAATPGAWSGVGMPAGRGSWGAQDPYAAAGTGAWIPQGAGAMDATAALQAALRLSSSSMSADSAADMAALARGMSDASTHSAALLQAVLSGRMSGSSTSEGIDPSALADAVALANRLSDASMGAASALSDRLSSESLLASAVGTPSSRLLTGQQGMGTAGEAAAAAAAAGLAAHQLSSAAQEAAAGGATLGSAEPGFAGPLQRYGSNVSLGASRRSIGGRSSRGSGDVGAEEAATMAPQEQMPGTAPEEGLAQALANMKMALTHQQLAATTSTNHEVVISTLHQVLRDAAAQHASNMGQGAEAGVDAHP